VKGLKLSKENNKWKIQTLVFDEHYHDALQQQHYAAQFIALVGHHLIEQKPDDSNTNMQYLSEKEMLVGNELSNGLRIGLQLNILELCLLDNEFNQIKNISLNGKSWKQVFDKFKLTLSESNVDVSSLSDELHYEIPSHALANGASFTIEDGKYFKENAFQFHNSNTVLESVIADYKDAATVRVWPHHFDTGTLIPLSYNTSGELTRSIGLGKAIPDSMVDEPYYYQSFWSADSTENINDLSPLEIGEWKTPGWNGAVLRHSEILKNNSAESQNEMVKDFFKTGIEILTNHYK
jgi:hypothetical protein